MSDIPDADDAELMAAMAAAFGDDPAAMLLDIQEDDVPRHESLQELVARLDAAMASLGSDVERAVSRPTSESIGTPAHGVVDETRYVLFESGGRCAAFPLSGIVEIERLPATTPLPRTPAWLRGVANMRGQIVSVTDLATLAGASTSPNHASEKVIVVHSDTVDATTAVVVDRVIGIRSFPGQVTRRPDDLKDPMAQLATRVARSPDGLILLIDPDRLLSHPEMAAFQEN